MRISYSRSIRRLERSAVPCDTVELARFLLGKIVAREWQGDLILGRIVETEAYLPGDPACHAYRGVTPRNRSLFLRSGHAYVYLCYGTSRLLNVSSETAGVGAGVLLRALEPLHGIEHMQRARNTQRHLDLTRGPGRLTAALHIDLQHDGIDLLGDAPLWLAADDYVTPAVGESVRIGLTKGADLALRYFVPGNRFLSGTRLLNTASCARRVA